MSVISGHGHSGNAHPLTIHFSSSRGAYMRIIEARPEGAIVELTLHELVILNNAMNETLNELCDASICIRVGTTMDEFFTLFRQVQLTIQDCRTPVVTD
jgi:hypothetical protein